MGLSRTKEVTCDFCTQPLGQVSVSTFDGSTLHPDCYDKWREEELAKREPPAIPGLWGTKRGEA